MILKICLLCNLHFCFWTLENVIVEDNVTSLTLLCCSLCHNNKLCLLKCVLLNQMRTNQQSWQMNVYCQLQFCQIFRQSNSNYSRRWLLEGMFIRKEILNIKNTKKKKSKILDHLRSKRWPCEFCTFVEFFFKQFFLSYSFFSLDFPLFRGSRPERCLYLNSQNFYVD